MKYASQLLMSSFIPLGGSLTSVWTSLLFSSSQTFNAVPMKPHPIIPILILFSFFMSNISLHSAFQIFGLQSLSYVSHLRALSCSYLSNNSKLSFCYLMRISACHIKTCRCSSCHAFYILNMACLCTQSSHARKSTMPMVFH